MYGSIILKYLEDIPVTSHVPKHAASLHFTSPPAKSAGVCIPSHNVSNGKISYKSFNGWGFMVGSLVIQWTTNFWCPNKYDLLGDELLLHSCFKKKPKFAPHKLPTCWHCHFFCTNPLPSIPQQLGMESLHPPKNSTKTCKMSKIHRWNQPPSLFF